ncbi:MAG TPA: Trm112 family protein [Gemmataceae bacterium]|nr:Trm112 family protein [Gemmataceae bacterium]
MLSPDLLDILRCPLDRRSRLAEDGARLVCTRCGLKFPITDGFPKLIAEEAELPAGCPSLDQLPCQRERTTPGAPP